jgi:hypothetical protein
MCGPRWVRHGVVHSTTILTPPSSFSHQPRDQRNELEGTIQPGLLIARSHSSPPTPPQPPPLPLPDHAAYRSQCHRLNNRSSHLSWNRHLVAAHRNQSLRQSPPPLRHPRTPHNTTLPHRTHLLPSSDPAISIWSPDP